MASLALDGVQALPDDVADHMKNATVIVEAVEDSTSDSSTGLATPEDDVFYPHPTSFTLSEHPIDQARELKVRTKIRLPCYQQLINTGRHHRRRLVRYYRWLSFAPESAWDQLDYLREECRLCNSTLFLPRVLLLTSTIGWDLVRKHISWNQMRHSGTCVSVDVLTKLSMERGVCSRSGDTAVLATSRSEARRL